VTPILTVNAGSATVKLDLFESNGTGGSRTHQSTLDADSGDAAGLLRLFLGQGSGQQVAAIVHRIVHGGPKLTGPAIVDSAIEKAIRAASSLAPLHNPRSLAWLDASREMMPRAIQIAVPDTGFFADLPNEAVRYALPRALSDELGLRRYGFHGIAHQAMFNAWQSGRDGETQSRVISLQLGSGCSIAAIRNGRPIDTSMGFTPLEGLVMATRSGDIDPGLLLHLMRRKSMGVDEVEHLISAESGLQGLAGNADMRSLLALGSDEAEEAITLYCYRARKYVGAYLAALGGADAILFGGGVGENSPRIRAEILHGLEWAAIVVDMEANAAIAGRNGRFDAARSEVELSVVAVDEAVEMVRMAQPLVELHKR
jgi:acetate kinase